MGLALQVIVLAFAVALFVQRSAGSNISPSPSIFVAIPPIEGLPLIPIHVNAPSPSSLPNVSQLPPPPVSPPVNSAPGPESGTRKETAPTMPPTSPPPLPGQELVPLPSANPPQNQDPISNSPIPVPVAPVSATTSPPLPSLELVPPPSANPPQNQDPISNSPIPVPVAPVSVTTSPPSSSPLKPPVATTPPSSLPQEPPRVKPVVPRTDPPSSTPNIAPENKAPPLKQPVAVPPPSSSLQEPPSANPVVPHANPPSSTPNIAPANKAPQLKPHSPEPAIILTPPPSPSGKIDVSPVASPSKRKFHPISPQISSPLRAPPIDNHNASRRTSTVAPLSSPESPPVTRTHAPASLPSTLPDKHHHAHKNVTAPPPSPLQLPPPPSETAPPPKAHPNSGQKGHSASPAPSPSSTIDILPDSSPPLTPPPGQTSLPILSPKTSPSGLSPSHVKHPPPPPIHSLPPPPPNEDCSSLTCTQPYTNTPPGSPCGCVWPMQVGLRLGVALYTFFPLVSELAEEVSIGVFMRQSQVRIMGANAASQDPGKTIVLVDLVPLGKKFDNTTAYLTADRFWNKQVAIQSSLFGNYDVLYVRYPGLPPSPPSSVDIINGEPYMGQGGNARAVKPVGVDVSGVHHKKKVLSGTVLAIIVLSASVILILSIAVFWVLLSRRQCQQGSSPRPATLPFLSKPSGIGGSVLGIAPSSESLSIVSSMAPYTGSAKTFSSSDIEKATDNFNETKVLGEGGFGRVYSGVLEDGTKVAVKVLKRDDQQGGREFLAEVEMLSRLHHRNLVKLIGICTEDRARCLVYELVPNGSVESHIHGVDKEIAPLDWGSRLRIALGAARALAYLHEDSSPRVIHRDFKSSNILLEDDFTPKVSDFGLARTALEEENKHISTRVMGTFGYVAPEYAMTGHLLVKSDVYSYGVVLLELLTGKKPVDMSQPPGQENLVAWARPLLTNQESLESIIDSSLGPNFPFDNIAKVSAIASMCVQPEVSHRPFMGEVVQALKLVCNECDVAREMESRSCSLEDLSLTNSPISNYDRGIDVESGFSGSVSDIFRFKRLEKQNSDSFRRHSSSGPLRTERGDGVWRKLRRFSGGTVSEHAINFRLWSGSH